MAPHFILMADIISSRASEGKELMSTFESVVKEVNHTHQALLLSPLTITLGDEFQGIATSISSAVTIIINLEETLLKNKANFKLRYVLHYGEVETEINPKVAYGMLGAGLTHARKRIEALKGSSSERVTIDIEHFQASAPLNKAFLIFTHIIDKWSKKDYGLIHMLLKHNDYKIVAGALNKDRASIWRRQKTLRISEYNAIKDILLYLAYGS